MSRGAVMAVVTMVMQIEKASGMEAVIVVMQRRRKLSDFSSNWLCRKKKTHIRGHCGHAEREKNPQWLQYKVQRDSLRLESGWPQVEFSWSLSFTVARVNYILWQTPEFWTSWPSLLQLFERMCMALGGRAAESVIFNHVTTGNCFCLLFCVPCAHSWECSWRRSPQVVKLKGRLGTALAWGQSWWTRSRQVLRSKARL